MKKNLFKATIFFISCIVVLANGHAQVSRPPGNNGTGFFVNNGRIYDPSGVEFIPIGLNAAVYWDPGTADCKRNSMSNNLPASGANTVRIVTQTQGAFGWNANPGDQRDLVNRAVQGRMVPMLEMHDATCNANAFTTIVNYWRSAAMVQLCQDYERYMWVNIANEHDFSTSEEWRDSYISAIQQIRAAGIKNLIVVDAGRNCGQNPTMIPQYGQAVINADPQHNVVFSVHMYQFWRTNDRTFTGWVPPYQVEVDLPAIKNAGLPIVVGEFGWNSVNENYSAQILINTCRQNNIGWYFWSEFDQPSKPHYSIIANICGDLSSGNRTPAGNFIIPYMQNNAVRAPVFGGTCQPVSGIVITNCPSNSLNAGSSYQLNTTISPANVCNSARTWSSSNISVATVNSSGLVTAVGNGTSIITVRTTDGNRTATCNVIVTSGGGGQITLQAEDYTTQNGGANSTAQSGYTGSGYYDMGGNGTWSEYVFNAPAAGSYTLSIRYANGGTTNRPCNVITNGASASNNFVPTGAWTTWQETTSTVSLNAGNNTIRIQVSSANGGANIDRLVLSPTGTSGTTLQAENFTTQNGGATSTAQAGYTGTGYFDMGGNGSWAEYVFNMPAAGSYSLSIRYANGGTTNRTCNVITNGVSAARNFGPTGAWTTWMESTGTVNLNAGNNTIRIQATTADGGSNIDRLVISSTARIAASGTIATKLTLFPNPATNKINIPTQGTVYISNLAGQLVKTVITNNGIIDISDLATGIYMVKVNAQVFKLIKK